MSIRSEILHLLNINSHTETRELAGTIALSLLPDFRGISRGIRLCPEFVKS